MPDPGTIHAAVNAYVRALCAQPNLALSPDTRLDDLADMDSLKWIETIAVLEERLGVQIDTQQLEHLATLDDIVTLLTRAAARANKVTTWQKPSPPF
jgi:acyl carrier protein